MNRKMLMIYLSVMTVFSVFVVFSMPISITTVIFCGIFVVNMFLFMDIYRKD